MVRRVKLGVDIPNYGYFGDPRRIADFARRAEDAGWDGLSLWDHIYIEPGNVVADPWVALAAAATVTKRISLQMLVTPTPRRRPWKLARECVSLDQLSNGRFVFGVGIGNPPGPEFGVFGDPTDDRRRGEMLDESLAILTGLWSGDTFSHDGDHYRLEEVQFLPTPVQRPRIPIWAAGVWPRKKPFRRAAQWDGVAAIAVDDEGDFRDVTLQDVKDIRAYIDAHRQSGEPYDVAIVGGWPADHAAARDHLDEYADAGVTWFRTGWAPWQGIDMEAWIESVYQGPPGR